MRRWAPGAPRGRGWRACALALLVTTGLACGPREKVGVYDARGVVRGVQPDYGQLIVAHDAVPGLMPAMTMNFDVADSELLRRLEPGQAIEFRIRYDGKSFRILSARVTGEAALGDPGPSFDGLPEVSARAPDFRLVDQDGRPFEAASLRGKAVVLDFVYVDCPGPCPILTGLLVELQRRLPEAIRRRTRFVSITLDPERDTPPRLREYARARGIDLRDWALLTGASQQVAATVEAYGVGSVRRPDGQLDHVVVTFLIDPQGRIVQRYVGLEHEPDEIARDLERVLGPAAGASR